MTITNPSWSSCLAKCSLTVLVLQPIVISWDFFSILPSLSASFAPSLDIYSGWGEAISNASDSPSCLQKVNIVLPYSSFAVNGGVGFLGITVLRVVQFAVLFRVLRKVVAGERFNAAVRREVGRKMAMLSLAAAGFAYAFVLLHAFRAPLENGRTDRVVSNLSLAVWYLIRMEVVTNVMFAGFLSGRFPSEEPEGPGMIVYAIVVVLLALPWSRLSSWRSLVGFLPYLIPSVSLVTLETDHLQYGVVAMCVLCVLEWGVVVAFRDVFPGGNLFGDVVNSGGVLSGEFFASGVCLGSAYLPLLFAQWLHVRLYRELLFHSTRSSHPIYTTLQDMVHLWESWKTPYGGIHLESALFISIEDQVVLKSLQDLSYSQEGNYKRGWDEEYVEADGMAVVVVFGGQSEVVSVGLDDTVGRLQRRINQLFFSVAHEDAIEVTFNDTVLHDPEQHLSDVGIAEGDTLYATLSKQYLSRRECYVLGINESSLSGRLPPPRHLLHHPETLEHFLNACFEFSGPALETFCALLSKPTNLCQILHRSEAEWCRYVPAIVTNAPPCQDFSVEDRYRMLRYMGFFESTLAVNALLRHVVRNGRRLPTTHIRYTLHLAHEVGTCPTLCAGMDEGDVIGCVLGASSVSEVCQILDLLSDLGFNEEMHAEGLIKRAMSRIKGRGDALLLLMIALMERGKCGVPALGMSTFWYMCAAVVLSGIAGLLVCAVGVGYEDGSAEVLAVHVALVVCIVLADAMPDHTLRISVAWMRMVIRVIRMKLQRVWPHFFKVQMDKKTKS